MVASFGLWGLRPEGGGRVYWRDMSALSRFILLSESVVEVIGHYLDYTILVGRSATSCVKENWKC
jgi:hypothetical protein